MSYDYGNWGNRGPGQQWGGAYGPPPGNQGRIDVLDVMEGVLKDGFSVSNLARIARASGSGFWVGAAIGAGAVLLAKKPELRAAVGGLFTKDKSGTGPSGQ